jgi:hypothetical protein
MGKIIFLLFFIQSHIALAVACCGGGSALPSLVTTDDRAQFSVAGSYNQIVIDSVDGEGIWRRNADHQTTQTIKFDYAYVLDSDIQFGLTIPLVKKEFQDKSYTGLADVQITTGYEYWPELDYNIFQPKGFVYSGIVIPTGFSKFRSDQGGFDSRGQELWGLTVGHVLVKNFRQFDFLNIIDLHHYFDQNLKKSNGDQLKIQHQGVGGQLSFSGGYNTDKSRLGFSVAWIYESPLSVKIQSTESPGSIEKYGQAMLSYSYMLTDLQGLSVSYSDQTLVGTPLNTSLGRSISIQLNQRWTR